MLLGVYPILVSQIVRAPAQRVANLTRRRWRTIGAHTLTTTHAPPALLGNAQLSGDKGISQRLCWFYHFGVRKERFSFPIRRSTHSAQLTSPIIQAGGMGTKIVLHLGP